MITTEIAQAAIEIAEEFDRRGLKLTAREDSPLHKLTASASVPFVPPAVAVLMPEELNRPYEPNPVLISDESNIPSVIDGENSKHTIDLEALVLDGSDLVSQHLSFAKNVVRPLIVEYTNAVSQALAAYPDSATFNPIVVRNDMPAPMLNPAVQEAIEEYRTKDYRPVTGSLQLPHKSGEEVIELLKTGSTRADADIDAWVATRGADFFRTIWSNVFSDSTEEPSTNFESLTADKATGDDALFAVYLLSSKLLDNPPEGTEIPLNQYRKEVGELVDQSALRLANAYERRALNEKTGLMVINYDKSRVVVFAPVYDAWLAAGGSHAALFGNILSDRPETFAQAIDAKAPELVKLWERQNLMLTATLANKRYVEAKRTLCFQAEELIAKNLQQCFGDLVRNSEITFATPEVAEAMKRIVEYVENLTDEDIKDVWKISSQIVAGGIFYYTDALRILQGIDSACKENPGIDVNEAALLSTIEYVVDFIASQMYVSDL